MERWEVRSERVELAGKWRVERVPDWEIVRAIWGSSGSSGWSSRSSSE